MSISRRKLLQCGAAAVAAGPLMGQAPASDGKRPNIVWIVCHDIHAPLLGCYGNSLAKTPTIDAMAARGVQYENAFSTAPVCAPSRFALVTGMYASSCGPAQDMRATAAVPEGTRPLPLHMRAGGYYCTNNVFTDYNLVGDQRALWDDCNIRAHWRNRPSGKPFFSVYNYMITHESHVFGNFETATDPHGVSVPPFLPDKPEIRKVMARNTDMVNEQDKAVAHLLAELEQDGLADDTFVFFLADHGGVYPRSKRYCFDNGLHVPMILQVPKNFAHLAVDTPGKTSTRMVSNVDMAPTVLKLAGLPIPANMAGTPFVGDAAATPRKFAFSMRDRMDERYDLTYSVRDERFRYTRNYAAQRIYAQHEAYEWQSAAYQAWERAHLNGELNETQSAFWKPKPAEELYDLKADPHSIRNLIDEGGHKARVNSMRAALDEFLLRHNDNGFIPEDMPVQGYTPSRAPGAYPLQEILRVANLGLTRNTANAPVFLRGLQEKNEVLRYWHAHGLILIPKLPAQASAAVERHLAGEKSAVVSCALAEALLAAGRPDTALPPLLAIAENESHLRYRLRALNVLSLFPPDKLKPYRATFEKLVELKDEYVPEPARLILLHMDGAYTPDAKVFIAPPGAPINNPGGQGNNPIV